MPGFEKEGSGRGGGGRGNKLHGNYKGDKSDGCGRNATSSVLSCIYILQVVQPLRRGRSVRRGDL